MTRNSKTLPWQNENKTKNAPPTKHVSQRWEACAHKAMPLSVWALTCPHGPSRQALPPGPVSTHASISVSHTVC